MIYATLRLEFEHVFPDEYEQEVLYYLKKISSFTLLNIIGFSNINPQPNFDDFISNLETRKSIVKSVTKFLRKNNILEKPILVSREASLRIAEIILSNRNELIEKNQNNDIDTDEINLFKAFLATNKQLNSKLKATSSGDNIEKLIDITISTSFSTSDMGNFENSNLEFGKLIYATIVRFELLIEFIKSKDELYYLEEDLCSYFTQNNSMDLSIQIKFLFTKLLELKINNGFKLEVTDKDSLNFLNSLASNEISEDEDFTNLRNYPIYKLDNSTFSIIDFFFVVDKFYKSTKFILKNSFNKKNNLCEKDRKFFEFFNTEFSENFLMKRILDQIFNKSYFVKKTDGETHKNEPDYYIRCNNKVFLFENKDVLIAKNIKSSGDIEKINEVIKSKFLEVNNKPIGVGQLITSIAQIIENQFKFDEYVNKKKNITIYPILLINDRIFEIPGVNYRLNQWYIEKLKERLGNKFNADFIKSLTIIDIDTLIFWTHHLVKSDSNFRKIIDEHLRKMNSQKKVNHVDIEKSMLIARKNLYTKIAPISERFNSYQFPTKLLLEKFKDVVAE